MVNQLRQDAEKLRGVPSICAIQVWLPGQARASNMRVVLALSLLSSAAAGVAQVDYFFGSK